MRIRLRSKGTYSNGEKKFVLEKLNKGKLLESRTVPKIKVLWEMLCLDNDKKVCLAPTKKGGTFCE